MKYILFVAQEGTFETRSLLLPVDGMPRIIRDQLDILRQHAKLSIVTSKFNGQSYAIDQLIIWKSTDRSDYNNVIKQFINYANKGIKYFHDGDPQYDSKWIRYVKFNLCSGFDHLKNFYYLRTLDIIEDFLILQS